MGMPPSQRTDDGRTSSSTMFYVGNERRKNTIENSDDANSIEKYVYRMKYEEDE